MCLCVFGILQFFSSSMELFSNQASPFVNLKSLKVYPVYVTSGEQTQNELTMPNEVKSYLLGGSPGATFTMVSYEVLALRSIILLFTHSTYRPV